MEKQALRNRIWDELEDSGNARFPYPPHGRIPNFAGAADAADRLESLAAWRDADVIKSNPDAPQLPVRRAALRQGKIVYMAVPRLRDEHCFLRLDPATIEETDSAATIGGASEYGVPVHPEEMEPIDLIVSGSVAVNTDGDRVGKGEGYSDLEFAILREFDLVDDETPTVSTIHEIQLVDQPIPTGAHDVPIEHLFTPGQRHNCVTGTSKPAGIDWECLPPATIESIPILQRLQP